MSNKAQIYQLEPKVAGHGHREPPRCGGDGSSEQFLKGMCTIYTVLYCTAHQRYSLRGQEAGVMDRFCLCNVHSPGFVLPWCSPLEQEGSTAMHS